MSMSFDPLGIPAMGGRINLMHVETDVARRRHPEWVEWAPIWTWLYDSWEGGDRYRNATYGQDDYGFPLYNLRRHKRENPIEFTDPEGTPTGYRATDDDFQLRRARTPVPGMLPEAIEQHLSKIYSQEIDRRAPKGGTLAAWWENVDGKGTQADEWYANTISPLLMALGCLDIIVEFPPAPKDAQIRSKADSAALGLDRPIASYILPQNMVWWELNEQGRYLECLFIAGLARGGQVLAHWTAQSWALYSPHGGMIGSPTPHGYGFVPIVRIFDQRLPRCRNVGRPRYYRIADLQREYYNRDSELILSDTQQAHPLIQCPEDYIQVDGSVAVGPSYLLPKKKNGGGDKVTYEPFSVLEFPKEGAESIRLNKADILDAADRAARLTRPAGAAGTTGSTVGQSGISKRLDQNEGNALLSRIAKSLQWAETSIAELVLAVATGKPIGQASEAYEIHYPGSFDLMLPEELGQQLTMFQDLLMASGQAPETEIRVLCQMARLITRGLTDREYAALDREIRQAVEGRARKLDEDANHDTEMAALKTATTFANNPAQLQQPTDWGAPTSPETNSSANNE